MKYLLISLFSLTLFSCTKTEKKEQPFDSFVYSYSAMNADYSIKFTNSDTVYFQKRYPTPIVNYYALVKDRERDSILALTTVLDFKKYDSLYVDPTLSDGEQLKFYKEKKNNVEWIYVADMDAPKEFFKLAAHFNEFSKNLNFQPYPGKVDFGNLKYIELPTPPPVQTAN